jgi:protein SCO1/2
VSARPRRSVLRLATAVAAGCALAACDRSPGKPSFKATDVTGAEYGKAFELTDHTGAARTLADYRGKVVVLFFGYTQCPDVCPTTLATMAEAMKRLGPDADRVRVLFVTVDPDRDTPAVLGPYVTAFDPRFVGLYGDAEATRRVTKEFKVFFVKAPGSAPGVYTIDHTAASYVLDPAGRLRLYVRHSASPDDLLADLRTLLSGA